MAREVLIRSDLPPVQGPSSHGVKAGDWAFTAGMLPLAADSIIVGTSPGVADVEAQSARCVQSMSSVLEALDVSLAQVTKVKSYMSDLRHRERYESAYAEAMPEPYPAHACVGALLPVRDAVVQLEATACVDDLPQPVELHSQPLGNHPIAPGGTTVGDFFFSNAHPSIDAEGILVARGDIRGQVEQALDNLGVCLAAAGFDFADVVKMNCTVPAWYGFMRYNEIYAKYFREPFPARATVQGEVSTEAGLLEFEAVAAKGADRVTIESVVTGIGHLSNKKRDDTIYVPELPGAMAPHSHAVRVGAVAHMCGQIPWEPSGLMIGWSEIRAQTRKTLENHVVTMHALGATMDDIVKTNVTITEAQMIPAFLEEYARFFTAPYPAMTIAIGGLAQDCMVLEIEAVAVMGASQNAVYVTA